MHICIYVCMQPLNILSVLTRHVSTLKIIIDVSPLECSAFVAQINWNSNIFVNKASK